MELRPAKKRSLVINLTSLIDVLFLLLIFFMVTTTFISQPAIQLQLPEAEHAQTVRQSPIVVYVDERGGVFLNDEPMEPALLGEALRRRLAATTDRTVFLKADARVSHGQVVRILDIVRAAGARRLSFSTRMPGDR